MPQKPKFTLKEPHISTEQVGKNIAKIRKTKGLTQTELAEKIGISQNLVSHYEIGRLKISAEMIIHFSIALNVNADKILGLTPVNESYEPISPALVRKMKDIEKLPPSEKRALMKTIDKYIKPSKS
jgi:transcriptional regulator with XRE-family HTH domain